LSVVVEELELEPVRETTGRNGKVATYIPVRDWVELCWSLAAFLGSFAYLCLFRRYTTIEPDEGIVLQGAQRILHGQVPYRDFFSFLTPGSYYQTAAFFKLFGSSFGVPRTTLAVFGSCMTWISYALTRRVCSRKLSLLVAAVAAVTALPYRFLVIHNWDSTLWACFAVYSAVRLIESRRWAWSLALGSSLSLTFLFEQSKGAGLLLGLLFGFVLITRISNRRDLLSRGNVAALALGLAWPILTTVAYFGSQHALTIMMRDWLWPLQHYSRANRVPYGFQNWSQSASQALFGDGSPLWTAFYLVLMSACFVVPILPLVAVALLVYWSIRVCRGEQCDKTNYYVVVSAAATGLLLSVIMVRADIIHFMYLLPLLAVVLGWILDGRNIPGCCFKFVHAGLRVYLVAAFLFLSVPLLQRAMHTADNINTRRGRITTSAEDTVIRYVQAKVKPEELVLVYPYLPLYNYLTDTEAPTKYEYFQPGMNTQEQAADMLVQLQLGHVRWVLFEPAFAEKVPNSWPETPMSSLRRDPIADYIKGEYRPCEVLNSPANWHFVFMAERGTACPQ
jgi:Dolichyl-phosphate-mannose-protein mannosyltransferase